VPVLSSTGQGSGLWLSLSSSNYIDDDDADDTRGIQKVFES